MSLVLVNKRGSMRDGDYGTACPQCIPWLGKVLIDDVYSGGKPDGKHKLLSEAMAADLPEKELRGHISKASAESQNSGSS